LNEQRPFTAGGTLKHWRPRRPRAQALPASASCWILTGRAGTTVEIACLYTI
jgi:hypothetical protein